MLRCLCEFFILHFLEYILFCTYAKSVIKYDPDYKYLLCQQILVNHLGTKMGFDCGQGTQPNLSTSDVFIQNNMSTCQDI